MVVSGLFLSSVFAGGALFSRIWVDQSRGRRPLVGGGLRTCAAEASRSAGRPGTVPVVVGRRAHGSGAWRWRWRWDGRGMQMESSRVLFVVTNWTVGAQGAAVLFGLTLLHAV